MSERVDIPRTRRVIQGILGLLATQVSRTALVKLVYLSDNRFFESTGRTITGNAYMWDHYGPNAVSQAIANEADELADKGTIRMSIRPSMYGGDAYQYWVDNPDSVWQETERVLSAGECQILLDVANRYGRMSLGSLIERSKETRPFVNAGQYESLRLHQDEGAKEMRKRLASSGDFLEDSQSGLDDADAGDWVSDDHL